MVRIGLLCRYVNDHLYFKLNNLLEKEAAWVERTQNRERIKHYRLVEHFRILISNREALSFLCISVPTVIRNVHVFTPKTRAAA